MGLPGLFISVFLITLTGAMMPGPMLTVTLDRTARIGWKAGPLVVSGHGLLELITVLALLLGLGRFLTEPSVTMVTGIAGGLFLIYMSYSIVKGASASAEATLNADGARLPVDHTPLARQVFSTSLLGVTTSIGNPYYTLWWGTIGAGYLAMALQGYGAAGVIVFFVAHFLCDALWYTAVSSVFASGGRRLPVFLYTGVLRVLGIFLMGTALYFIYTGATALAS